MKLFQIKTAPIGVERIAEYLEDNYVCIGYPGLGDLEFAGRDEIRSRLIQAVAVPGAEIEAAAEALDTFVHSMEDGDYVVVADGEWVHLGDLGDYFYDDTFDQAKDGRCHRRGVTWLKSLPRTAVNPEISKLLAEEAFVSRYTGTLPSARLDLWIAGSSAETAGSAENAGNNVKVDAAIISEAIAVLREALHSSDTDRRERAAIAILQYAK
ncbi:hypothetical protein C2I18_23615 [Paenibacillus sp. PK3_47]|uniref:hypothetical protein n=1 Tax=Paenibacillus sp. PK3_47 TaxID=2072642 RepID=UPI00201D94FB|nr:hypothetical protein [Paenibacillus sp. PK3_47]UQZ36249.1 hypothetical protein C2I18_23615 [Paenibacillus sp. PK3_47]